MRAVFRCQLDELQTKPVNQSINQLINQSGRLGVNHLKLISTLIFIEHHFIAFKTLMRISLPVEYSKAVFLSKYFISLE